MDTKPARPTNKKEGDKSSKSKNHKKPNIPMASRKKPKTSKHQETSKSHSVMAEQLSLFQEPLLVELIEDDCFHQLPAFYHLTMQKYTGEMSEDQFHGEGVAVFEGGHVYKGRFSKGVLEGYGVFTWADGVTYEGGFVRNLPSGQGQYTWSDGSYYKGGVCNGVRHGTGTYKNSQNGVLYVGQWEQSKRHGRGEVFYNTDQTSWYKGDWEMNNREGWGVRCYPSGDIYIGQWKNNLRHGEGSFCWQGLGQQYDGSWLEGLQHGEGTHVWLQRRVDGSLYCQSNRYTGEFLMGKRHGRGSFFYASGAIYEGEWRNNRKHGQGKLISKDCQVYVGEFVDDQIVTSDPNSNRALTPHCALTMSGNIKSVLDTDMTLSIARFLENNFPESRRETEHKQVEFVVLRYNRELRAIYTWYSRLGRTQTPDNIFQLSHMQRWRLLKDCNIHRHGYSLTQLDRYVREQSNMEESSAPSSTLLLRRLLGYLVIISYHILKHQMSSDKHILASCFTKLLTDILLPNTSESEEQRVKGFVFSRPARGVVASAFIPKCWEFFKSYCKDNLNTSDPPTMTCRELLLIFQKLNLFSSKLTTKMVIDLITGESPDPTNVSSSLQLEMNFLEFFEVLIGCAGLECLKSHIDKKIQSDVKNTNKMAAQTACRSAESRSPLVQDPTCQCTGYSFTCCEPPDVEATKDPNIEMWIQMVQQFFNYFFFPVSDYFLLLTRKMKEDKMQTALGTDPQSGTVELK